MLGNNLPDWLIPASIRCGTDVSLNASVFMNLQTFILKPDKRIPDSYFIEHLHRSHNNDAVIFFEYAHYFSGNDTPEQLDMKYKRLEGIVESMCNLMFIVDGEYFNRHDLANMPYMIDSIMSKAQNILITNTDNHPHLERILNERICFYALIYFAAFEKVSKVIESSFVPVIWERLRLTTQMVIDHAHENGYIERFHQYLPDFAQYYFSRVILDNNSDDSLRRIAKRMKLTLGPMASI